MTDKCNRQLPNFEPFQPTLPLHAVDLSLIGEGLNPEAALVLKGRILRGHIVREGLYERNDEQPAVDIPVSQTQVVENLVTIVSSLMDDSGFPPEHYLVSTDPIHQQALEVFQSQADQVANQANRFIEPEETNGDY